ncbi:MAG TPA: oligosaccharide flippase family protein, partial [Arenibaculum sp.]|nr:oligosaccharide flippase family protein [Arenibaculum sp.]
MRQPPPAPSRPTTEAGTLRRLVRGGVWTTIDAWVSEAANILVFLALVRLLAPSEFGIVAMATVFVALASDLGAFSLTHVLIQRKTLETGHVNAVFLIVMALSVLAFAVLVVAAPAITALYGQPEVRPLLLWLSPVILLNALTAVPIALLTREMQFARLAGRSFSMVVAGGVVGVGMAVLGFGPWALVGQQLARAVVSIFALTLAADWRPSVTCSARHLREVRTYMLNTFVERVIAVVDKRAVQFILGWLLGPAALGYYNVASRLVEILLHLFTAPISQLVMPGFSRIQGDAPRVRSLLEGGVRLASLISYPAFVGTAVIAPL